MVVISMNSKRQRRPNVRLGEIGDFSAALLCGFYAKGDEGSVRKRCKNTLVKNEENFSYGVGDEAADGFRSVESGVSLVILDDSHQNREGKNGNSSQSALELVEGGEEDVKRSELSFCNVQRKVRVMKRRARNVFNGVWSSNGRDEEDSGAMKFVGLASDACSDGYTANELEDLSDHEIDLLDVILDDDHNNVFEQEDVYRDNNVSPASGHTWNETKSGDECVNAVTRWLEDQGFGRYAGLFEMHEVDSEALPLLTLDDLKEMGLFAVGSRRKLYAAIQQLRKGNADSDKEVS